MYLRASDVQLPPDRWISAAEVAAMLPGFNPDQSFHYVPTIAAQLEDLVRQRSAEHRWRSLSPEQRAARNEWPEYEYRKKPTH